MIVKVAGQRKTVSAWFELFVFGAILSASVSPGLAQSPTPNAAQTTPQGQVAASETPPAALQEETVPQEASLTPPVSNGVLQPEEIPARREALSGRLETLRKAGLPKEEMERVEAAFGRVLKLLADLQEAVARREGYLENVAQIPQRLEEVGAQQQIEESAKPAEFEEYTEGLLGEYTAKLNALQAEVENLAKELSQGDIRAARLAEEINQLEARSAELATRLQELGYSPGQTPATAEGNAPLPEMQELALERQLVRAQIAALEVEREWLTKRRPLQERLLNLARLRAANTERDLGVITERLLETVSAQRKNLRAELASVEQQMTETDSRAETVLLGIRRKMIETRMQTLDLIEESKEMRAALLEQEKLTARMNQEKDRLIALMEKYGAGEWVAQRVMVDLEKFERDGERELETATPQAKIGVALREANKQLFEIGTERFEADERGEEVQRELSELAPDASPARLRALKSEARRLTQEYKQALQQQEQVLTERVQALTKLIELNRQQEELVKSLYSFVLTRILWLRNREPLGPYPVNFDRLRLAADAGLTYARRVYVYVSSASVDRLRKEVHGSLIPYLAFTVLFLLLPVGAVLFRRRAKARLAFLLERSAQHDAAPGLQSFLLVTVIAAVWPAYIFLFLWVRSWFVADLDPVVLVLREALQLSALVLWVFLFVRYLLKQQGWAMQYWRLTPEACRLLRWTLRIGCGAAFLFLVPRYAILSNPELGGTVEASLALVRILMICFQLVLLVLLATLLRRRSSFSEWLLGRSYEQHGLLWKLWPFLYLLALASLAAIIGLSLTGFQYAAGFFWERAVFSLAVAVAFWAVFAIVRGLVSLLIHRRAARAGMPEGNERAIRWLNASLGVPLFLLAVSALLEVWGFSVVDFMATPLGKTLLWRGLFIAAAIAVAVIIIQLTNAIVMSLLAPRILAEGRTREAGRKLQTIGPLTQTIVKVVVCLIAFLVVLEQVGVATGPILAGVGIFGLAIGFAAQSLIKDIINGLFILFEGSLAVGDIVNISGIAGQVEKVTLRSVRVRDLAGNVHFVPNSIIDRVENMTKDFSRYLMDVPVAYREDTDEAVRVMKEVDEGMRNDPLFKWDMLEPIEILGVDRFAESAVVVKARLKTRPMQQWRTGREYNRRLKKAFEKNGIQIPLPHRTIFWGETKEGQRPLQIDADSQRFETPGGAGKEDATGKTKDAAAAAKEAQEKNTGT